MDKKIITKDDIEKLLKGSKKDLIVSRDTVITSIAMELINREGINIIYENEQVVAKQDINKAAGSKLIINNLSKDLVLSFYYLMLKIRFFEALVKTLREKDIIPGVFVHSYIGQEAVAAGVCSALKKQDYLTSTHRGHGHLIAKGANISKMLAEMLGKEDGYCKGKGGSMHITDINIGILGANGIVGAGLPIACGSALASKFSNDSGITVSFFWRWGNQSRYIWRKFKFCKDIFTTCTFLM